MRHPLAFGFTLLQGAILVSAAALAHDIHAKPDAKVPPAFDITSATASTDGAEKFGPSRESRGSAAI